MAAEFLSLARDRPRYLARAPVERLYRRPRPDPGRRVGGIAVQVRDRWVVVFEECDGKIEDLRVLLVCVPHRGGKQVRQHHHEERITASSGTPGAVQT